MKFNNLVLSLALFIAAFIILASSDASGQFRSAERDGINEPILREDVRPFDFSNKYYEDNGLFATLLIDRRSGSDGKSVLDFTGDPDHRNVRITETFPAYGRDGEVLYWNHYGDFYRDAFTSDGAGEEARVRAEYYPVYIFPSVTVKNAERQAAMIGIDDAYFEKNPLGLGVVMNVEYTEQIFTKEGQVILEEMGRRNGISLDGTPIIRTDKDLDYLTRERLVRSVVQGTTNPGVPFTVAKILKEPADAITPDAYLVQTLLPNGEPLAAERVFKEKFECYKTEEVCK